jgi:hypothetical protein
LKGERALTNSKKRRKMLIVIGIVALLLVTPFATGIVPKFVAEQTVQNYVQKNYPDNNLKFNLSEYSFQHKAWHIQYTDGTKTVGFMVHPSVWPNTVMWDQLKPVS